MELKKIFFSYSRIDADFALKLALDLKKEGFDVWIDQEDIRAGSEWDLEIEKALETCDYLLFIQSERSVTSANVLNEVYYALEENKRVIPIIINESKTPFRITRLHHISFIEDYETGLANLLNQLKSGCLPELQAAKEIKAFKKFANPFAKKYSVFILLAVFLVIIAAVAVVYSGNTKKQTEIPVDKLVNLDETFTGEWELATVEPKAKSQRGYLKIEATGNGKVKIISNFQFYYFKTNDTAFLSVFNGYAGCESCILQNEIRITDRLIDIGTQRYEILKENHPGGGKTGDTVLSAGGNNSIRASVTLHLINKDTVIIKVQQPVSLSLSDGFTTEPFIYSFLFKKIAE
jgi:hypothetical protein